MVVHAYTFRVDRIESYSYKRVVRAFGTIRDGETGATHDMFVDVHREYTRDILAAENVHVLLMDLTSKKIVAPVLDDRDYLMNGVLYETNDAHTIFSFGGLICGITPAVPVFRIDTLSMLLSTADRLPHLRGDGRLTRRSGGRCQSTKKCTKAVATTATTATRPT